MEQVIEKTEIPTADQFVTSPLRSRIKLELNASVSEIWELVGDPSRMPEYSEGLEKVETMQDSIGNCAEFTCYFKPLEDGQASIQHRQIMKWYEPLSGWAAIDEEPNNFGLTQSLALITLTASGSKTILTWEMHFNSDTIEAYMPSLEEALNKDLVKRLIRRFGGSVLENYIEGKVL